MTDHATPRLYGSGAVLGKFMPGHVGHLHLIRFACSMCETVTVVVDRVPGEWPDADSRAAAMRSDLAGLPVRVVALPEVTPQEPGDHPRFWEVWRDLIRRACGGVPGALVCAMEYGLPLAKAVGSEFVPLDIDRDGLPVRATDIRADPWSHWRDMLPAARLPFLARVAVEGPESTGKTTTARAVARALGFGYAPEWAACFVLQRARAGRSLVEEDMLTIAHGQVGSERSLELAANRALVCDSSLLTTMTWSEMLWGRVDPRVERLFEAEEAHAPRQRWFFTPETPWVDDEHRRVAADASSDATRWQFWDLLTTRADRLGLRWDVVPGGFAEKEAYAMELARRLGPPPQVSPAA